MAGVAEYAAQLYWRHVEDDSSAVPPHDSAVQSARAQISDLLKDMVTELVPDLVASELDQRLNARFRIAGLTVRNPGIADLWIEILQRLFVRFDSELRDALNFTARDAIAIMRYIHDDWPKRISHRLTAAANAEPEIQATTFSELGEIYRYGVNDIARDTLLTAKTVQAVFAQFGIRRGVREKYDDGAVPLPSPYHPYMAKPLLLEREDTAIVLAGIHLLWAILPGLEDAIKKLPLNTRYLKHRGKFLETEAAGIMRSLLGSDAVLTAAQYRDEAAGVFGEVDVLGRFDNTGYLIECKSEPLRGPVRRGAEDSFRGALKSLLFDAHGQLTRAVQHAVGPRNEQVFLDPQVTDFLRGVTDVEIIIVTPDHIGALGAAAAEFARAGAFGGRFPWVLSLLELTMVADLIQPTWNFKNYVRRRLETYTSNGYRLWSLDELDFVGLYLETGHCVFEVSQETVFLPHTATLDINHFYNPLGKRGSRKPRLAVPESLELLFRNLQNEKRPRWSEVVCDLLALHPASLSELASDVSKARADAAIGHIFTKTYGPASTGIGFAAGPSDSGAIGLRSTIEQFSRKTSASDILVIVEHGHRTLFGWYAIDPSRDAVRPRGPLGVLLLQRPHVDDVGSIVKKPNDIGELDAER